MIIDCHCHIASRRTLPDEFYTGWAKTLKAGLPFELDEAQSCRIDEILEGLNDDPGCTRLSAEMDAAGISKAVLLIIDFGIAFKSHQDRLEELYLLHKEVMDRDDRYIVFAGVDPRRGKEGFDLFVKSVTEWGFRGLKLYPPCGYSPSDRALFPYYEVCRAYGMPVLVHIGPTSSTLSFEHSHPMGIDAAALNFPEVNFILGHAGVTYHAEAGMQARYRPNIYLDMSGFQSELGKGGLDEIVRASLRSGLSKKLLFGTDWPIHRFFGTQEKWVSEIKLLAKRGAAGNEDLENMFHRNFSRICRLEKESSNHGNNGNLVLDLEGNGGRTA
jgi:predicted TIM-barrel fold metal-dependent hydrolase